MLHIHALWYFDTPVTYPQWFRRVKFVLIPPRFIQQQYLWNIAIEPAVGCYNSWANIRCSGCSPLGEISLWNGTIPACSFIIRTDCWGSVFAWFSIAQSVCECMGIPGMGIQSAGDLVSQTSKIQILHSAEGENLSPYGYCLLSIRNHFSVPEHYQNQTAYM